MTTLLEVTNVFEPTKANIETMAQIIAEQSMDGADPIRLAVQLTAIIQTCEAAKAKLSEIIVSELDKSQGLSTCLGAKIERAEVGTKYDYSTSEAWVKVSEQEKLFSDRRKAIETIAKNAPEGTEMNVTDESTGETWAIKRAAKSSKSSFKITLSR